MPGDLPIGPQWRLSAEDIQAVAAAYGLDVAQDAEVMALGGAVNGVVRVGTAQGDVVFRIHRPWTTPERLASVQHIQGSLRAVRLPIPRVHTTIAGDTWTVLHGRCVEVLEYVPNDGTVATWEQMGRAFALLGLLHSAIFGCSPAELVPPAYGSYTPPQTALAMLQETDDFLAAYGSEAGYAEAVWPGPPPAPSCLP